MSATDALPVNNTTVVTQEMVREIGRALQLNAHLVRGKASTKVQGIFDRAFLQLSFEYQHYTQTGKKFRVKTLKEILKRFCDQEIRDNSALAKKVNFAFSSILDLAVGITPRVEQIPQQQVLRIGSLGIRDQDGEKLDCSAEHIIKDGLVVGWLAEAAPHFVRWVKKKFFTWMPKGISRWAFQKLLSRDFYDLERAQVYKAEGNRALGGCQNALLAQQDLNSAVNNYKRALEFLRGVEKRDSFRVPILFKKAQAHLLQGLGQDRLSELLASRESFLCEEAASRSYYRELFHDLLSKYYAIDCASDLIDTSLGILISYHQMFAEAARQGRIELDAYVQELPQLKDVKESLLELTEVQIMPDVLARINNLTTEMKDPEKLAKTLEEYRAAIVDLEGFDQPLETSLKIHGCLSTVDHLIFEVRRYRLIHQEVTAHENLQKLLGKITPLREDLKNRDVDILTFAEDQPQTLISIVESLNALREIGQLPEELCRFVGDAPCVRDAFMIRAIAYERIGRIIAECFEKVQGGKQEEIAKDYLKQFQKICKRGQWSSAPYETSEGCFLMAYMNGNRAKEFFDIKLKGISEKIKKIEDRIIASRSDLFQEHEPEDLRREMIRPILDPEKTSLKAEENSLKPFVDWNKKGIDRAFDAVLRSPLIILRGTSFVATYGGKDDPRTHEALGNWYYYMDDSKPVHERYEKAVYEYGLAYRKILEHGPKEGEKVDEKKRDAQAKRLRERQEKATHRRVMAEQVAKAVALLKDPSRVVLGKRGVIVGVLKEKSDEDLVLEKLENYFKSAYDAEYNALMIGCPDLNDQAAKANHRRKIAKEEKSDIVWLCRTLADIYLARGKVKEADHCIQTSLSKFKDEGFKPKNDFEFNLASLRENVQKALKAKMREKKKGGV